MQGQSVGGNVYKVKVLVVMWASPSVGGNVCKFKVLLVMWASVGANVRNGVRPTGTTHHCPPTRIFAK